MDEIVSTNAGRVRVGWLTFGVGVIDVMRWIPESITVSYSIDPGYVALVILDVLLALTAIVAGLGVNRHHRWAEVPALLVWGALASSSAVFGRILLDKYHWDLVDITILVLPLVPRLSFYLGVLALMPFAIGVLFLDSRRRPSTVAGVIGVLLVGLIGGAAFPFFILHLSPK